MVSEDSMLPTLQPGDGLIAIRSSTIRRGQIRCFEHPGRTGFWMVKRVGDLDDSDFQAVSDNPTPAAVDSRRFGPVPIAGSYRMLLRIPRRFLR